MDNITVIILLLLYISVIVLQIKLSIHNRSLLMIAVSLHFIYLVIRTMITGHAPFSGAFESMLFFPFLLGVRACLEKGTEKFNSVLKTSEVGLIVIFLLGVLFLPAHYKIAGFLPPALKSIWFFIHVPMFFLGYVSLAVAFALAIYAIRNKEERQGLTERILAEVRTGYLFVSGGLITGCIWAFICWGRFWGWDSKEVWALATWLLYTVALHISSKNKKLFLWAVMIGFIIILFTYLGVMFILPGIHSYR